jgi:hypothetical protein
MATTGPETSLSAFSVASSGFNALFDVVLHRLDHNDRVVHYDADGQHQSEQRHGVDGESEGNESVDLRLNGGSHGLFNDLSAGADVSGFDLNGGRGDLGIPGDGQ